MPLAVPVAAISAGRSAAASAAGTLSFAPFSSGPCGVPAEVAPAVTGRRAILEAHHAARAGRLLVARPTLGPCGVVLLLLALLARQAKGPGALALENRSGSWLMTTNSSPPSSSSTLLAS